MHILRANKRKNDLLKNRKYSRSLGLSILWGKSTYIELLLVNLCKFIHNICCLVLILSYSSGKSFSTCLSHCLFMIDDIFNQQRTEVRLQLQTHGLPQPAAHTEATDHLSGREATATCNIRLTKTCPLPAGDKAPAYKASQGEQSKDPLTIHSARKNSHLSANFCISSSTSNFTTQRRRNRFSPFFSSLSGVGRTICSSISP